MHRIYIGYCHYTFHGFLFFFFNDTATTEIYTLSLHDALPIFLGVAHVFRFEDSTARLRDRIAEGQIGKPDRKSTRLNSSHSQISYAVFCLKKNILLNSLHLHLPTITTIIVSFLDFGVLKFSTE